MARERGTVNRKKKASNPEPQRHYKVDSKQQEGNLDSGQRIPCKRVAWIIGIAFGGVLYGITCNLIAQTLYDISSFGIGAFLAQSCSSLRTSSDPASPAFLMFFLKAQKSRNPKLTHPYRVLRSSLIPASPLNTQSLKTQERPKPQTQTPKP